MPVAASHSIDRVRRQNDGSTTPAWASWPNNSEPIRRMTKPDHGITVAVPGSKSTGILGGEFSSVASRPLASRATGPLPGGRFNRPKILDASAAAAREAFNISAMLRIEADVGK
jgi:hypothetical protein